MALEQIGLQAVFQDKEFQNGINNYQKEVGAAEKATDAASSRMSKLGDVAKGAAVIGVGAATAGVAALVAAAKFGVDALNSWNDQVNTLSDNLGTTGEQSAVWAAAFNHVGLSVDEGGTGLNFFTKQLAALKEGLDAGKVTPFGEAMNKLGVSAVTSTGDLRTFDEIMPDLLDRFQELPAGIDKTALAMELFGTKGGTKFIDFLSQGSEGLEHARQMVKDFGLGLTTEGSGAIEEFGFAWNDLQLGFQGVLAQIGLALLPTLQTLIAFVTTSVLPVLGQWAQKIMPILVKGLGDAVTFLTPFVAGIVELGQQLFAVLTGQADLFEDFGADFAGLFGENEDAVWNFVHAFATGLLTVKSVLGAIWDFIQPILAGIFNELSKFWTEIQPRLEKAWNNIYNNIIVPVVTAIARFIEEHQEEIKQVIEGAWQFISGVFQTAWALISGIVKIALDLLGGDLETAGKDWEDMMEGVWEGIQNIFMGAWKAIGQFVLQALIGLNNAINDKMEEARQGIVDKLSEAIDWLRSLPSRMTEIGVDIIQGLIEGFWREAGNVQQALGDIIQQAIDNILGSLGLGGIGGNSLAFANSSSAGRNFAPAGFAGAGAGDTTNSSVLNVTFNGSAPSSAAEAETQSQMIYQAAKARGII